MQRRIRQPNAWVNAVFTAHISRRTLRGPRFLNLNGQYTRAKRQRLRTTSAWEHCKRIARVNALSIADGVFNDKLATLKTSSTCSDRKGREGIGTAAMGSRGCKGVGGSRRWEPSPGQLPALSILPRHRRSPRCEPATSAPAQLPVVPTRAAAAWLTTCLSRHAITRGA
jgi:hypothetical protein